MEVLVGGGVQAVREVVDVILTPFCAHVIRQLHKTVCSMHKEDFSEYVFPHCFFLLFFGLIFFWIGLDWIPLMFACVQYECEIGFDWIGLGRHALEALSSTPPPSTSPPPSGAAAAGGVAPPQGVFLSSLSHLIGQFNSIQSNPTQHSLMASDRNSRVSGLSVSICEGFANTNHLSAVGTIRSVP